MASPPASSLPLTQRLTPAQVKILNTYLDELLLALSALTGLDQEAWQRALQGATDLDLGEDLPIMAPGETALDLAGLQGLVGAIGYLCGQYQELLRRAVTLMEQTQAQGKDPFGMALLGNYREALRHLRVAYGVKRFQKDSTVTDKRALELLTELFFYSSPQGPRRLWGVLLEMAQVLVYEVG